MSEPEFKDRVRREATFQPQTTARFKRINRTARRLRSVPASVLVTVNTVNEIVPVASNPLVRQGAEKWTIPMPMRIPDHWQPRAQSSEEYAQSMRQLEAKQKRLKINQFPQSEIQSKENALLDVEGSPMQSRDAAGNLMPNFYLRGTDEKDKSAHISYETYMGLPDGDKYAFAPLKGPSLTERRALGMAGNGVPRQAKASGPHRSLKKANMKVVGYGGSCCGCHRPKRMGRM